MSIIDSMRLGVWTPRRDPLPPHARRAVEREKRLEQDKRYRRKPGRKPPSNGGND